MNRVFSLVSSLCSVSRFSMVRLSCQENVMEHSGMVVLFCYLIGTEINAIAPGTLNMGELLSKAIVHDVDELITGDIPRPTKYHNSATRAMFRMIEEKGIVKIADQLRMMPHVNEQLKLQHKTAKLGKEGQIVALADLLAVAYKVFDEILVRHNHSMLRQAVQVQGFFIELQRKLAAEFGDPVFFFLESIINETLSLMCDAAAQNKGHFVQIQESFDAN